jgi:cytochrome c nitrite reductase small subunit
MSKVVAAVFLIALAVLALVVGLGWGVVTYTATPTFCNTCHVMNTRYVSWQRSSHGIAATCIECHSEPGWWEELKAHLNGTRYLYVMLTGEKTGPLIRAEVSDASCLRCHQRDRLPEVVHNHRVLHAKHLGLGVNCVSCHAGLVHGSLYGGEARPTMRLCVECHAQRSPALAACQSCHVQPTIPAGVLRVRP